MFTDNLPLIIRNILAYRRRKRLSFVLSKILISEDMNIIDIGCGIDGRSFSNYARPEWKITGIDILPPERVHHAHKQFNYVQQDARDLTCFRDHAFDLAISIGMLEHITEDCSFKEIVSSIRRVAKQYIIIVPFKYALIEPHYGVPLFPIIPDAIKNILVKLLNLSNHRKVVKENPSYIRENYRWLSNKEYLEIFPEAKIHVMSTLDTIAIIKCDYPRQQ